jgi:wobble nucleotide-excising tRNase
MSGGHWDYLSHKLQERAEASLSDAWRLLAAIEHELDWGKSCDTCYECAKIRSINALEAYFDTQATSIETSVRLLRSSLPECDRCKEAERKRKERA